MLQAGDAIAGNIHVPASPIKGDPDVVHPFAAQPATIRDDALLLLPETAEELDVLERSRLFLASLGCPLELWEILLLIQSGAWDTQRRIAPLPEGPAPTPAQALHRIREEEGAFVRDLRCFLERTVAPPELPCAEIVIGAVAASRGNRAAVLRWISDPARFRSQAERRIASLSWRARKLMEQLDRRRAAAWEASVRAKARSIPWETPPDRSVPAPAGPAPLLHPRMLADLRRAHRCSYLLREHLFHRIEPWELVLMLSAEGDPVRAKLDALLTGERTGEWARLEEMALGLVGRSVRVQCEWGTRVRELQSYLQGLSARPLEGLIVGIEILLCAPAGRRRAARWIESPIECAAEAALYMSTVLAIADRYRAELESNVILIVTKRVA
jgi:hypothetical protein